MLKRLKRNRKNINRELSSSEQRQYFSPALFANYKVLIPILEKWLQGEVLDIGAGDMPLKNLIQKMAKHYHTLDVEKRADGVDFVVDVMQMDSVLAADKFDTVLLLHVLEHISEPKVALQQIYRVLKPNGILILAAPHLSRLHELPHDYFRFTQNGLKHLLTQTGFEVRSLQPVAGLFSFLGHQVSTVTLCSTWHLPVIKDLMFSLNKWLVTRAAVWLDDKFDKQKLFAMSYLVVGQKPDKDD